MSNVSNAVVQSKCALLCKGVRFYCTYTSGLDL